MRDVSKRASYPIFVCFAFAAFVTCVGEVEEMPGGRAPGGGGARAGSTSSISATGAGGASVGGGGNSTTIAGAGMGAGVGGNAGSGGEGGAGGDGRDAAAGGSSSIDGGTVDATTDGRSTTDVGTFDAPPPTNGTDDWRTFGHDAGRSFVSSDVLVPPLSRTIWSWTTANTHMKSISNVVTAGRNVHLHGIGDGPHDHVAGANNPFLQTVDMDTAATIGTWSIENDFPVGDWYAATLTKVIVNDDSLSMVDVATFNERTAASVGGICQVGDSDGEVVIDEDNGRFYAFNRGQYHDINDFGPGFCIPPGNVSAYNLTNARSLWNKNLTKHPVTSTAHLAYAGGVVYFSVVYDANGNGNPAGVAPDDGVYAFDAASGAQKWLQKPPAGTTYDAASTDGRTLYVVALSGGTMKVQALDAATGAPGWTSPSLGTVQSFGRNFRADPPAYFLGALFVYTGKSLIALDRAAGTQLWAVPNLTGAVQQNGSHLAISGGSGIVYLTDSTSLQAFKASDGSQVWSQTISNVGKVGSLVLARGRAIVIGSSGAVALASP